MSREQQTTCLILSGVRGDTRRYRALHLLEQLQLLGVPSRFVHLTDPSVQKYIQPGLRFAILHRVPYEPVSQALLERMRANGTVIISDFDDLVFNVEMFPHINSPDFADPVRTGLYKSNMENLRRMLAESEGAIASTDYLSQEMQRFGKRTWVHRNAFSLEMLHYANRVRSLGRQSGNGRVVIGYASGTPTHNRDFEMIRPALQEVMRRCPRVDLSLIGPLELGTGWEGLEGRIMRQGLIPWRELPGRLCGFDINLAPLVADNPFSQSKSEIKYMEAGMLGIPTVASPTDAFAYAIRQGENGYLASSEDEWVNTVLRLAEDSDLRRRTGEQARQAVMENHHPSYRAAQLAALLNEISAELRGQPFLESGVPSRAELLTRAENVLAEKRWLTAGYEKDPSNFQLGLYSLRHDGLKPTVLKVWVFVRRLLSPIFPFRKA